MLFESIGGEGERRQVTALFCDLADSVSIATRLDPEDLSLIMDAYVATCHRVIHGHGGVVVQDMGDGVLAYFGYPATHEEAPIDALKAALALRSVVNTIEVHVACELAVRIGVATGVVVVAESAAAGDSRPRRPVGQAPNLAARLQTIAPPGAVLVSADTWRLTQGAFVFRDLGTRELKGFPEPMAVFEVLAVAGDESPYHGRPRAVTAPLVGRERELAAVLNHWRCARASHGRLVILRGEAGIGKSRLVDELRVRAAAEPHATMMWYCGPTHTATALYPVVQQLARAARFQSGDETVVRREKLARLLDRFGGADPDDGRLFERLLGLTDPRSGPDPAADPETHKSTALDKLIEMMLIFSEAAPALFVLEDAHWCDPTTLGLMERAAAMAARHPWLIVVTARPEFARTWPASGSAYEIPVDALDKAEAAALRDHFDPDRRLPQAAARLIVERADGVPLFVEEVTRAVLDAGFDHGHAADIPMSLKDSLAARLDRLGPARRTARVAAVIGRRFQEDLLREVAGVSAEALGRDLGALEAAGLIERGGDETTGVHRFRHGLIRDAAYESLLKSDRQITHARIARTLVERFPAVRDTEPERIAHHLAMGGSIAEAVPYWATAAVVARISGAYDEGIAVLQGALNLLRDLPAEAERARLLFQIQNLAAASRGFPDGATLKVHADIWAACLGLNDSDAQFSLSLDVYNHASTAGNLDLGEAAARLCMEIAEQTGDAERLVDAAQAIGFILAMRADLLRAKEAIERAIEEFGKHDTGKLKYSVTVDQITNSLGMLMLVNDALGDPATAERLRRNLRARGRVPDRPIMGILSRELQAVFAVTVTGRYRETVQLMDEAIALSRPLGLSAWGYIDQFYRSIAVAHLGEAGAGIVEAERWLDRLRQSGQHNHTVHGLNAIAELKIKTGDLDGALRCVDEALGEAERMGERLFLSPVHRRRAEILAAMPGIEPADVMAAANTAVEIARAQGAHGFVRRAEDVRRRICARFGTVAIAD